jgi:DNA-binding transcriptional ArsR family regulator
MKALGEAADCLRTLAHPVRLRFVEMLLEGRFTVGELAKASEIPSHSASEHLRLMQRSGLLTSSREGRCTYYEVVDPHLEGIIECMRSRFG